MSRYRTVAAMVGLAAGCGRVGFEARAQDASSGFDGPLDDFDAAPACIASTLPLTATPTHSDSAVIAWSGSQLGVAWREDPTGTTRVHFQTVSLGGMKGIDHDFGASLTVAVGWNGASWRVVWGDDNPGPDREILVASETTAPRAVTANGKTDTHPRLAPMTTATAAILWAIDAGGMGFDLVLEVVDNAGARVTADLSIASGIMDLRAYDVVWTGAELAVFYALGGKLWLQRVSSNGAAIGAAIPVVTEDISGFVSASWTGDRYVVAWVTTGTRIVYVGPTGALLSPILQTVGTAISLGMSTAAGASSDLVVMEDVAYDVSYVQPVARDGTLGVLAKLPRTSAMGAVWTGTGWAIAAAIGDRPRDIAVLTLCP